MNASWLARGTRLGSCLPFAIASEKASSWMDVLQVYQRCAEHLKGVYTPTTEELYQGLVRMPSSWQTCLFYYSVVKPATGDGQPAQRLVSETLRQLKRSGNVPAMRRVFAEDVHAHSLEGAHATLVLASYTGMWEQALQVTQQYPKLKASLGNRRLLISTLSAAGQVPLALQILREDRSVDPSPSMVRPIVKRLSSDGDHVAALRLTAKSLAAGYGLTPSVFAALVRSLRETGQPLAALDTAIDLNLFALSREEVQRSVSLFNRLVDCMYDADPYAAEYTVQTVVRETTARMSPREFLFRPAQGRQQFRLRTIGDILRRFHKYALPLSHVYGKCIAVPGWYVKPLAGIADMALSSDATVLVLDTNFLIQCVSKNLPLEHFHVTMKRQYPHALARSGGTIVVVPFTVIQEAYTIIWSQGNRLRHTVRLLLWSRVTAFVRQPSVLVLSLTAELPTMSMSILTRMAYVKAVSMDGSVAPSTSGADAHHRDPDARILNVCIYLHHVFRSRQVAESQGTRIPEGATLFAFLKYHVRRYTNTVKGSACDRVLLCTMDRKLAQAAHEAGVDCFPILS